MGVRRVELERISIKSTKPFDAMVAALEAGVGHPNLGEFFRDTDHAEAGSNDQEGGSLRQESSTPTVQILRNP